MVSGFNVFGIDIDISRIKLGLKNGALMGITIRQKARYLDDKWHRCDALLTVGSKDNGSIFDKGPRLHCCCR